MRVRELTPEEAEQVASWRYPGRYATYDVGEPLTLDAGFYAIEDEGELIGLACLGAEARVEGVEEEEGTVDVGYGMHPDLMGHGHGHGHQFTAAIFTFVRERHPEGRLRVSILHWNARSRRVVERHEFRFLERVGDFDVLVRDD